MKNYLAVNINYCKKNEDHVYVLETDRDISSVGCDLFGSYSTIARFEQKLFYKELSEDNFCSDDIDSFYETFKVSLLDRIYNHDHKSEWCLEIKPSEALVDWFKGLNKKDRETQESDISDYKMFSSIQFIPHQYDQKDLLLNYLNQEREAILKKELSFYQPEEFWEESWKENMPRNFFDINFRRYMLVQC